MSMLDKQNILSRLNELDKLVLELGCGERKKVPDSIGIDALDYPCVDIVGDVLEILSKIPDKTVQSIHSSHFVEHLTNFEYFIKESARILEGGGLLEIIAPHFSNPYYYSDHTHKQFFGLYTLSYFSKDNILTRQVPNYQKEPLFELTKVKLCFKSSRPFYVRHSIKLLLGTLFNFNTYMKELYEENFCYLFPCYEIQYRLKKIERDL